MDLWRDRTRKLRVNQVLENEVKSIFNFSVFFFSAELTEINTFFHFFTFSLLAHCTGSPKGCARSVPYRFVWWVFLECTAFVSWINQEITSLSAEFAWIVTAYSLSLTVIYWLVCWIYQKCTGFFSELSGKQQLFCWIFLEAPAFLLNFRGSTGFSAEFCRKHWFFCWIFQKAPVFLLNFPGSTDFSAEFSRNEPACLLSLSGIFRLVCYVCLECTGLSAMFALNVPACLLSVCLECTGLIVPAYLLRQKCTGLFAEFAWNVPARQQKIVLSFTLSGSSLTQQHLSRV